MGSTEQDNSEHIPIQNKSVEQNNSVNRYENPAGIENEAFQPEMEQIVQTSDIDKKDE